MKNENVQPKERQVLTQLPTLRRMCNARYFKWWSMIQAVAFYGWGVGKTALAMHQRFIEAVARIDRKRAITRAMEATADI